MAASADEAQVDGQDIFYVCKKAFQSVKEKLQKGEEITKELVNELTFPEDLPDDEVMMPVDMRGVGEDFDDVEQMVEKLGHKGTAEAFIKASDYFIANKGGTPEDERPAEMTAAEWRKVLEEDDQEDEEEDLEGEEEDIDDCEEPEEEEADGDEAGEEPAAKKAKTE